jgi:hypothetical protein
MNTAKNRAALQKYLESGHKDLSMMAPDVIFTTRGRVCFEVPAFLAQVAARGA